MLPNGQAATHILHEMQRERAISIAPVSAFRTSDGHAQLGTAAVDVDPGLGRPALRAVGKGAGQLALAAGDATFD
jgi:hypothetical protein